MKTIPVSRACARLFASAVLALALAGCSSIKLTETFNAAEAQAQMRPGTNSIRGSALMRQRNGVVQSCAGGRVVLVPGTRFAKNWFQVEFGTKRFSEEWSELNTYDSPPGFLDHTRTAVCNVQGFFQFDKLADGEYVLHTNITWRTGLGKTGGSLTETVRVSGGENAEVTLAAD